MTNSLTVEEVATTIEFIESIPTAMERFIPARYPNIYAYDYLRSHASEFGLPQGMGRSDCASFFRNNSDKDEICRLLADAYLREWNIKKEIG